MENLIKNWQALKNSMWISSSSNKIYIDEEENVFALKNDDGTTSVVAYAHIATGGQWFQQGLINFTRDIIKLCEKESWSNSKIVFVLNIPLRKVEHLSRFRELPNSAE